MNTILLSILRLLAIRDRWPPGECQRHLHPRSQYHQWQGYHHDHHPYHDHNHHDPHDHTHHHHDHHDHNYNHDDYQVFLILWWWMGMLLFLASIRLFYRAIQCKYYNHHHRHHHHHCAIECKQYNHHHHQPHHKGQFIILYQMIIVIDDILKDFIMVNWFNQYFQSIL